MNDILKPHHRAALALIGRAEDPDVRLVDFADIMRLIEDMSVGLDESLGPDAQYAAAIYVARALYIRTPAETYYREG